MATAKSWHQSLTPTLRDDLRSLHKLDKRWNWIGLYFVLNWIVAGWLILNVPHSIVQILCTILIGMVIHGLGNLMHEGCHGNLFRKPAWDRWVGFLAGAPAFFSITAYQVTHTLHHKHNRTVLDPDEFMNITSKKKLLSLLFYLWIFIGMFLYLIHVPLTALLKGKPRERRRVLTEYGILLTFYGALFLAAWTYGFTDAVVRVWLIPCLVAAFIGNVRSWAEHMLTIKGHPLTESRTVTSSKLFSLYNINLNYHTEHHLFPRMPWYNLPKAHRLLMPECKRIGTSLYTSYALFLFDAVREGVHGLAPRVRRSQQMPASA